MSIHAAIYEAANGRTPSLLPVLAKYVVMTRQARGCINVDFLLATLNTHMFLVYEKWDSEQSRAAHYASELVAQSAAGMSPYLAGSPTMIQFESISAYDEGGLAPYEAEA